jgi:hypothetical protein
VQFDFDFESLIRQTVRGNSTANLPFLGHRFSLSIVVKFKHYNVEQIEYSSEKVSPTHKVNTSSHKTFKL